MRHIHDASVLLLVDAPQPARQSGNATVSGSAHPPGVSTHGLGLGGYRLFYPLRILSLDVPARDTAASCWHILRKSTAQCSVAFVCDAKFEEAIVSRILAFRVAIRNVRGFVGLRQSRSGPFHAPAVVRGTLFAK